jgi:hypothetical protein
MSSQIGRVLALSGICVAVAALLAGCGGGGGGTDSGGFTQGQFNSARDVLDQLGQTGFYDAALKLSYTEAEVPNNCVVHIDQQSPLTFHIFLSWLPNVENLGGTVQHNAASRAYSWLDAVITSQGLKGDYSFHQGNEQTLQDLRSHYGDVFSKPVENCLVLQNQKFGLLPAGS